jgi:hypothetical protein
VTIELIDCAIGVNNEIKTQENISQTTNNVGSIGESFIPQAEPNQPPSYNITDLPTLSTNYSTLAKKDSPSKNLLRSRTGHSKRKRKAKHDQSSTQANNTHKGLLKFKCLDNYKVIPKMLRTY